MPCLLSSSYTHETLIWIHSFLYIHFSPKIKPVIIDIQNPSCHHCLPTSPPPPRNGSTSYTHHHSHIIRSHTHELRTGSLRTQTQVADDRNASRFAFGNALLPIRNWRWYAEGDAIPTTRACLIRESERNNRRFQIAESESSNFQIATLSLLVCFIDSRYFSTQTWQLWYTEPTPWILLLVVW